MSESFIFIKAVYVAFCALPRVKYEVNTLTAIIRAKRIPKFAGLSLPLLLLSVCLSAGALFGFALARARLGVTGEELARYFNDYLLLAASRELSAAALVRTLVCFFRAPLLAFLLGFASIGVVMIPLLCAFEGFLFAFSLCCFAGTLGRGSFLLVMALFLIRMLFVLPCTLYLSVSAIGKAKALALFSIGGGKRVRPASYGAEYWYRFGIVCVCLLIGSMLELWLVPRLLLAAV